MTFFINGDTFRSFVDKYLESNLQSRLDRFIQIHYENIKFNTPFLSVDWSHPALTPNRLQFITLRFRKNAAASNS